MNRVNRRAIVGLLTVIGVAVAVVLAVVGLPYGRSTPDAFAHTYTGPNGNTHLHIDAVYDGATADPTTDPAGWCDPIDATATVAVSSTDYHYVGICLEDYDALSVNNFELRVQYSGDPTVGDNLNIAPEVANSGKMLDDNPNANDGNDDTTGLTLGDLWDCTGGGVAPPVGDDTSTGTVFDAHIVCNADLTSPDQDLSQDPGLLATIKFQAVAVGTDSIDFTGKNLVVAPEGGNSRRCVGPPAGEVMGCFGATIEKVADVSIEKTVATSPVVAGSPVTFDVTVSDNVGGGTQVMVLDSLPAGLTYNDTLTDTASGGDYCDGPFTVLTTNDVVCGDTLGLLTGDPPGSQLAVTTPQTLHIVADVPLSLAGKSGLDNEAGVSTYSESPPGLSTDPNPANNSDSATFGIAAANIDPSKTPNKTVFSETETIVWSLSADSNGTSPASDVTITDTVDANQSIGAGDVYLTGASAASYDCIQTGSDDFGVVGDVASCTLDDGSGAALTSVSGVVTAEVDALVIGSTGNQCVNDVTTVFADPSTTYTGSASGLDSGDPTVTCLPPTTRMEKDIDTDATSIIDATNLFIEKDGLGGLVPLTIYELVSNAGNDPDGIGAYEFQLKFDHKIFDIEIADTSWLSNGGSRTVDCSMTIITENDIRWGCVSSGPIPGQMSDGVAAIITVYPEPDLIMRLTPGQENGVFRVLLDENCELADVFGDPLALSTGELAPGVEPGGTLEVCSDMAITVRILEGDLNLDCVVDVLDQQLIAYRYGAFFGNLLYDPWYDLQPALKDFDIDIKDLQKVWGRQGSTCAVPIPAQDPLPMPDP